MGPTWGPPGIVPNRATTARGLPAREGARCPLVRYDPAMRSVPPETVTMDEAIVQTDLALPMVHRGKVRDVYALPDRAGARDSDRLVIVATDRISAFDVVLPTPIPGKGRLLTELSVFWLRRAEAWGLGPTHLISDDVGELPDWAFRAGGTPRQALEGRVMIVRRCRVVPIECVVRGYLEGSGWRDYQATGRVSGVVLPAGLRQCDRLPEPVFTPSTKAEPPAHDEPISFEQACERVGAALMEELRRRSLALYHAAADYARAHGIIIADTKFEFGQAPDGTESPVLVDEVLTPDSSRFWPAATYRPGSAQPSFDKQFVREYLMELVNQGRWDRSPPGPALPPEIVRSTLERYREARDRLLAG